MKKLFYTAILLFSFSFVALAQESGKLELSIYGGAKMYQANKKAYEYHFKPGFGLGVEGKYQIYNQVYWVFGLNGGTDDGTSLTDNDDQGVSHNISYYRRDYNALTGLGVNLYEAKQFSVYAQAMTGIGFVQGSTGRIVNSKPSNVIRESILEVNYLLSAGTGLDYQIGERWKVGAFYNYSYLGDFDGSHMVGAKVSFIIP
ncbi:outer membrane beta-barrel protein [Porphyromonadaceae bacterium W3.11]|nr:outer membrane beta-barrel protein [Porphyromonadaceae bacterium W3.11]